MLKVKIITFYTYISTSENKAIQVYAVVSHTVESVYHMHFSTYSLAPFSTFT